MIRLDCAQGSTEWFAARLGIPTASCFDQIITNKTMKPSSSSEKYAHTLLAEQALGIALDNSTSGFMERGSLMEKRAADYYELVKECDTEKVGFVLRDDRRVGCSPDRFVGTDGLLEIKCPSAAMHVSYLLDDQGIGYRAQIQGQLWLCERDYCDTLSFHDDMPPALVRQPRDETFITALSTAVDVFLEMMLESKIKLQKLGMFPGERIPDLRVA